MTHADDRSPPADDLANAIVVRPHAWRGRSQLHTAIGVLWIALGATGFVFAPDLWDNWFRVLLGLFWLLLAVSLRRWERVELRPEDLRLVRPLASRSARWADVTDVTINWGWSEYPILRLRDGSKLKLAGYSRELAPELRQRVQTARPNET